MKAIILSVLSAIVAVAALAAPVGATGGFYLATNGSSHHDSWTRMGIRNGKFFIEGESITCRTSNVVMGGSMVTGTAKVNTPTATLPSTDNPCAFANANDAVNNPPANTTVTINGICGDPAEIAKIKAANANLIINSTGACPTNGDKPATPATIVVHVNAPEADTKKASATVATPSADNSNPKGGGAVSELPQTGVSPIVPMIAAGLAALTYAGGMAIRAFRARA